MTQASPTSTRPRRVALLLALSIAMLVSLLPAAAGASVPGTGLPDADDPRAGLGGGEWDAETAELGLARLGFFDKRNSPFYDARDDGFGNDRSMSPNVGFAIDSANSDMAFITDDDGREHVVHGNWQGFQIYDVSDPANPTLRTAARCVGGQGDVTVHGDLMFTSVEEARGGLDCTAVATPGNQPDDNRARGVRVWDISDLDNPVQLTVVQTCRGSHTHRLVEDPNDDSVVYIYNNGTSVFRHPAEAGLNCTDHPLTTDPVTDQRVDRWQIEIIEVPLDNPASARIIDEWRAFADGEVLNGLQNTMPGTQHPCAPDNCGVQRGGTTPTTSPTLTAYSPLPNTNTCHDITVYPEVGLAAGACQGNGLLIDITDPANPERIDAVSDVNFSYWHSANFNNAGNKVMFTDEWGGGTGARCRDTDRLEWGANALFDIVDTPDGKKLEFASYYKMPAVQAITENCVAHQANILPVPNRDIIVQSWYQGGISVFDWTDTANPTEIAYFDRGPTNPDSLVLSGHWSGYWFNGLIYGAEIARGLDVLDMVPTAQLSANEIAASKTIQLDEHNAMSMRRLEFPMSVPLARATGDQLLRDGRLTAQQHRKADGALQQAEHFLSHPSGKNREAQARTHLDRAIRELDKEAGRARGDNAVALRELSQLIGQVRNAL